MEQHGVKGMQRQIDSCSASFTHPTIVPVVFDRRMQVLAGLRHPCRADRRGASNGCWNPELIHDLMWRADVIKLNDGERSTTEQLFGTYGLSRERFSGDFAARYGWQGICITRRAQGCALFLGGRYVGVEAYPVRVVDTAGAGDAFAPGFLYGLDRGWPLQHIGDFANRLAAVVASRAGAVPTRTPEDLEAVNCPGTDPEGILMGSEGSQE